MIDTSRQVPAPSAAGWLFQLAVHGGPSIVVLRRREVDAAVCLAGHLVELEVARDEQHATVMLGVVSVEHVAVVW